MNGPSANATRDLADCIVAALRARAREGQTISIETRVWTWIEVIHPGPIRTASFLMGDDCVMLCRDGGELDRLSLADPNLIDRMLAK